MLWLGAEVGIVLNDTSLGIASINRPIPSPCCLAACSSSITHTVGRLSTIAIGRRSREIAWHGSWSCVTSTSRAIRKPAPVWLLPSQRSTPRSSQSWRRWSGPQRDLTVDARLTVATNSQRGRFRVACLSGCAGFGRRENLPVAEVQDRPSWHSRASER